MNGSHSVPFFVTYLDGIDGHQKDSPSGSGGRSAHRLESDGKILCALNVVQQGQDAGVGSRVSKSAHWSLDKCRKDPAVESWNTTVTVQVAKSPEEGSAVAVLVVDLEIEQEL